MSNQEENNNTQEEVILTEAEQQAQHEQAMIDKVDANEAKTTDSMKTDEEKMLAGKYKSVEELEKAYEHLQSKLGTAEEEGTEESDEEEEESSDREAAEAVTTEAGIDYAALEGEYQDNGGLSEETYNALAEAGIPAEMVNAYIAGQEALTQTTVGKMYDIVGGEAEYQDMIAWAQDNLNESEVDAFNSSLVSESTSAFAIQGLAARYNAEKGPNLVRGSQTASRSGGFNSKAEMMRDMSNPQYHQDPAFRAEVQRKVALSNF